LGSGQAGAKFRRELIQLSIGKHVTCEAHRRLSALAPPKVRSGEGSGYRMVSHGAWCTDPGYRDDQAQVRPPIAHRLITLQAFHRLHRAGLAESRHDRGAPAARMIAQDPNVSKRLADRRRWREMITQSQFDEMIRATETGEQWAEICRIEAEGFVEKQIGPWVLHEGRTWMCLNQLPWIDPQWCGVAACSRLGSPQDRAR
jgi:hypothetical protein